MFALQRADQGVLAVKSKLPRERVLFATQICHAQTLSRTCILWFVKPWHASVMGLRKAD